MEVIERQQRGVEDRLRQTGIRASAAQKELTNASLDLETLPETKRKPRVRKSSVSNPKG